MSVLSRFRREWCSWEGYGGFLVASGECRLELSFADGYEGRAFREGRGAWDPVPRSPDETGPLVCLELRFVT